MKLADEKIDQNLQRKRFSLFRRRLELRLLFFLGQINRAHWFTHLASLSAYTDAEITAMSEHYLRLQTNTA